MQLIQSSDFKRGMALLIDGVPHVIEEFHSSGTAKFKQKIHAKLRNLNTGRLADHAFADSDRVQAATVENRKVVFSYNQGNIYVFLDAETFEELDLTAEQVGERHWFFKENDEYKALFIEGKLMDILIPTQVPLQIVETAPAQKGGSDSAWKPAKLESGLDIMVPLFIDQGEIVRIDTQTRKYISRESS